MGSFDVKLDSNTTKTIGNEKDIYDVLTGTKSLQYAALHELEKAVQHLKTNADPDTFDIIISLCTILKKGAAYDDIKQRNRNFLAVIMTIQHFLMKVKPGWLTKLLIDASFKTFRGILRFVMYPSDRRGKISRDISLKNSIPELQIYPVQWWSKIFQIESTIDPTEISKALLVGMDPVSKFQHAEVATGIAFHLPGIEPKILKLMRLNYGLDCRDEQPKKYLTQGFVLVNAIRTIYKGSRSGSENMFEENWSQYTLEFVDHVRRKMGNDMPKMAVFSKETTTCPFNPQIATDLQSRGAVRLSHPSTFRNNIDEDSVKWFKDNISELIPHTKLRVKLREPPRN